MKSFLTKIALFSLVLLLMAYGLDVLTSHFLKKSHQYPGEYEVMNDIYGGELDCDIAIYGSSRAWVQIDPFVLQDSLHLTAYNFGIDGHNFWLQYWRHLQLLKYNNKPKSIIVSVDVFTLEKRPKLYELEQFLPYMLWDTDIRKYTSSYIGFEPADYFIPFYRYRGKSRSLKNSLKVAIGKSSSKPRRQNGYRGVDRKWNSDLNKAKEKQKKYKIKLDTASISLFEKFIVECKNLDIELILVYAPEFIEGQKYMANRNLVIERFAAYSNQYNLLFLDYSDNPICFNKALFYNSTHLNKNGAELFTKLLAHDIKINSSTNYKD